MQNSRPLSGSVAFVTGGSKGIGRAIAIGLARAGASVALTGRTPGTEPGTAAATAALITSEGGRALPLICDVRDEDSVRRCIDGATRDLGGLHVLVNNAGLYFPGHTLDAIDVDQWDETLATHLRGTFLCSRHAIPHLKAAGGGSIINLSSTAGDSSYDATGNIAYAVAKAGIEQITRGLALELAPHDIAVNAIRPMSLLSEGSRRSLAGSDQLKTFVEPSAICPAIVHLAQQRAGFSGNILRRTDFQSGTFHEAVAIGRNTDLHSFVRSNAR